MATHDASSPAVKPEVTGEQAAMADCETLERLQSPISKRNEPSAEIRDNNFVDFGREIALRGVTDRPASVTMIEECESP